MITWGHPVTVTLLRAGTADEDDSYGNTVLTFTDVLVPGCVVWPLQDRTSNELTAGGRDTVITGLVVLAPAGAVVTALDRMRVPGHAGTFDVVGEPADWTSVFTDLAAGVQVTLRRVTG